MSGKSSYEVTATLGLPDFDQARSSDSLASRLVRNLRLQDHAVLALITVLCAQVLLRVHGPGARDIYADTFGMLAAIVGILCLTRGELLASGPLRAMTYRAGMLGSVAGSYFILRPLLPALHPKLLDLELLALDERLFGQTPSTWLDQFVTGSTVEWFAFFYYSYYAVLAVHVVGTLVLDDGPRRSELLLGVALVASVGHAVYTLVPGAGPYACSQLSFVHPLVGGHWWGRVLATVNEAGAGLDIFPSLHTGFSTFIALHAVRHRRSMPYRVTWLPTVFCVANIVIATMFLRWHYGIDVVAGATLAGTAQWLAVNVAAREARPSPQCTQPVWEYVIPADIDPHSRRWLIGVTLIQLLGMALLAIL